MKVSLNWVNHFTPIDLPVDKLVEKIGAQLGAVEEVVDLGARYKGIVVAKVISCEKHPNADKLSVCMINDGKAVKGVKRNPKGLVQVVCGAPNVRAGQLVAWIPPGATVPSTYDKDPFVLEAIELRGVISNGMLASQKELAIGDGHEGILVIDDKKARPGYKFAKVYILDDHIIDIENKMFTHRPDLFGLLGVAREIAGIQHKKFVSPSRYKEKPNLKTSPGLSIKVKNEVPKLVPRFTAQTMSNVTVKPSPVIMQSFLARVGIRPINNVVDATNFVMYVTGQPMHAYDYDKLKTGTLGVRLCKNGEKLRLIGGKEITLKSGAVVITDGQNPIGLGGVMGGADTEVDASTKNIVLECATFDMNLTRQTAFEYGLFTDAVTRFTKGQSPRQNLAALSRCADEIHQSAGAMYGKLADFKNLPKPVGPVHVPASFINERLGLSLTVKEMKRLLENVEIKVRSAGNVLNVQPPFWRMDIEIPEDVVEEVGRLYGYDHLPKELPRRVIAPAAKNQDLDFKNQLREILIKTGANEVLTYSFVNERLFKAVGQDAKHAFHIRNALSPDLQYYRLSLTPSLLEKINPNIRGGFNEFAIYEIGKSHFVGEWDGDDPKVPNEDNHLALVFASKNPADGSAYYMARKYLEFLNGELAGELVPMSSFNLDSDEWGRQLGAPYEPFRSALIVRDNAIWGVVGEFRQSVRQALKLPNNCAGFEVHLDVLGGEVKKYVPLNKYPETEQDICLRTDIKYTYGQLTDFVIKYLEKIGAQQGYNHGVSPLDIFQRQGDKQHKQTTWRIILSHPERTLTTAETNGLLDGLAAEAKKRFNAERI